MKEHDFIKIIKDQTKSSYLGDDCAHLEDLGVVVSQDNFVEGVHFRTDWATPYQIGYKATAVNISDILASGAVPAYLTVGLSLPNVDESFIKDFYCGVEAASCGAKIIGGDITFCDKIFISISVIGKTNGRRISSRKNAKKGYVIVASGIFGESSNGLKELREGKKNTKSIQTHLEPKLDFAFSQTIATNIQEDYAMMDTSDGLADALFQIAKESNVKIHTSEIEGMFGAEDYKLVAAVPPDFLNKINKFEYIGKVEEYDGTYLQIDDKKYSKYDDLKLYDHFNFNL